MLALLPPSVSSFLSFCVCVSIFGYNVFHLFRLFFFSKNFTFAGFCFVAHAITSSFNAAIKGFVSHTFVSLHFIIVFFSLSLFCVCLQYENKCENVHAPYISTEWIYSISQSTPMFVLHLISFFVFGVGGKDGMKSGAVCVVYAFVQIFSWFSFRILFTSTILVMRLAKNIPLLFLLDNFQKLSHFGFYLQRIRFLVACYDATTTTTSNTTTAAAVISAVTDDVVVYSLLALVHRFYYFIILAIESPGALASALKTTKRRQNSNCFLRYVSTKRRARVPFALSPNYLLSLSTSYISLVLYLFFLSLPLSNWAIVESLNFYFSPTLPLSLCVFGFVYAVWLQVNAQ